MELSIHRAKLELIVGDITDQDVDAVVNAANSRLAGGAGVDGAIHGRGGPEIMQELGRRYPHGCPSGSAVITRAGRLPAKYVIHAVGPVWHGGNMGEPELLAATHRRSLELAVEHSCRSVAFPAISTGAYGFPLDEAASVSLHAVMQYLKEESKPEVVRFVLFSDTIFDVFSRVLKRLGQES